MTASNLGVVFGPTILRNDAHAMDLNAASREKGLAEFLIENYPLVWDEDAEKKSIAEGETYAAAMRQLAKQKFVVFFPGGKKTVEYKPEFALKPILEKICRASDLNLQNFTLIDDKGNTLSSDVLLGDICGMSITLQDKIAQQQIQSAEKKLRRSSLRLPGIPSFDQDKDKDKDNLKTSMPEREKDYSMANSPTSKSKEKEKEKDREKGKEDRVSKLGASSRSKPIFVKAFTMKDKTDLDKEKDDKGKLIKSQKEDRQPDTIYESVIKEDSNNEDKHDPTTDKERDIEQTVQSRITSTHKPAQKEKSKKKKDKDHVIPENELPAGNSGYINDYSKGSSSDLEPVEDNSPVSSPTVLSKSAHLRSSKIPRTPSSQNSASAPNATTTSSTSNTPIPGSPIAGSPSSSSSVIPTIQSLSTSTGAANSQPNLSGLFDSPKKAGTKKKAAAVSPQAVALFGSIDRMETIEKEIESMNAKLQNTVKNTTLLTTQMNELEKDQKILKNDLTSVMESLQQSLAQRDSILQRMSEIEKKLEQRSNYTETAPIPFQSFAATPRPDDNNEGSSSNELLESVGKRKLKHRENTPSRGVPASPSKLQLQSQAHSSQEGDKV